MKELSNNFQIHPQEMLINLLDQNQFELVLDDNGNVPKGEDLRLVYMMNDGVESFLIFKMSKYQGTYDKDYEGDLYYELSDQKLPSDRDGDIQKKEKPKYSFCLDIHQGEKVFSIFYNELKFEMKLYDYGKLGHFWVEGYEYLRLFEYRMTILHNKFSYIGEAAVNEEEKLIHSLIHFPPLNQCCYSAVPSEYIVPLENPWTPSEEAIRYIIDVSEQVKDFKMIQLMKLYRYFHPRYFSRYIAKCFHKFDHINLTKRIMDNLKTAASSYPDRNLGEEGNANRNALIDKAENICGEYKRKGILAEIIREEPFTTVKDEINFQVYVLSYRINHIDILSNVELVD